MRNSYAEAPHHELRCVEVDIRAGNLRWSAVGRPQAWLPLRHRQPGAHGQEAILRIVKSPTDWHLADGRTGAGHCEYHDLMESGRPVGLSD
jgi:hypothetical protein